MILEISIVIIIIIIIMVYWTSSRYISYYQTFVNIRYPKVKLSEYKHKLKNGDIILFINRVHLPTTSIFINTLFSHVGMVVIIDDVLMLSESIYGNYVDEDGVSYEFTPGSQLTNLNSRLNEYPGQPFIMPLKDELTEEQTAKLYVNIYKKTAYPDSFGELLKHVFNSRQSEKSRHCMQHVVWLLDQMGMIPTECDCGNTSTKSCKKCTDIFKHSVVNAGKQITSYIGKSLGSNNNTYEPILEIIFDDFK
jgi:hypothetical protein